MTEKPLPGQTGKDIQRQFKPITEGELEALAGTGSYGRGLNYYRGGHIEEPIVRGDTLHARCEGSQEDPYVVSATLARVKTGDAGGTGAEPKASSTGSAQITAYDCDCEAGGFCKHLVALLLTWAHKPETVEVRQEFAVRLQNHSREQLLALCVKLLNRQPDMEYLIETAPAVTPPTASAPDATTSEDGMPDARTVSPLAAVVTVDVTAIQRKAQRVFSRHSYEYEDYGVASQIASDLDPLVTTAHEYAQTGQWANAQAVYEAVALEAIDGYDDLEDEGDLAEVINVCCTGLAQCLDAQATLPTSAKLSADARQQLIETLYKLWEYDLHMGGIDLATDAQDAIARNVTAGERDEVETWLHGGKKTGQDFSTNFNNTQRAQFFVALKVHSGISDEEKLEEYRKYELYTEMTTLLLQLGRAEEAMRLAREKTPVSAQLTAFAGQMIGMGGERETQAFAFVEQLLTEADAVKQASDSATYVTWLATQYARHNQPTKALVMQERLFDLRPSQQQYQQVRTAAQAPGNSAEAWTERQPALIAVLEARGLWRDLTSIYIEEKNGRGALDALARCDVKFPDYYGGDLNARVATVAEADYPDEARILYQSLAEKLIAKRGRENYQLAASYLARAKDMAARLGRAAEWSRYIAELRDLNNRLPALKEELRARKLI